MLLRMYSRYFEKNDWKTITVDESPGEEAGLKSITLEVEAAGLRQVKRRAWRAPFSAIKPVQRRQSAPDQLRQGGGNA